MSDGGRVMVLGVEPGLIIEDVSQVRRACCRARSCRCNTKDIVIRPDDCGPAVMAVEPGREDAVFFGDEFVPA